MWRLMVLAASLAVFFASTFLIIKFTGVITLDDIKSTFIVASEANTLHVGIVVIFILFMDMFIAVPTLTVVVLSGYFMGPLWGAFFSILGMWAAGVSGYIICRSWGDTLLLKIYSDKNKLQDMKILFALHGAHLLVLCRAAPILPEVTCCLSGLHKIKFTKFFVFYSVGTIPYAMLAAFAGSKSSLDDPLPGVLGALAISGFLWVCWFVSVKRFYKTKNSERISP